MVKNKKNVFLHSVVRVLWVLFLLGCFQLVFAEEAGGGGDNSGNGGGNTQNNGDGGNSQNNNGGGGNRYGDVKYEVRDGKPVYAYRVTNKNGDTVDIEIPDNYHSEDDMPDFHYDPELSPEENAQRKALVEAERRRMEAENNAVLTIKEILQLQEKKKDLLEQLKKMQEDNLVPVDVDANNLKFYEDYRKKLDEIKTEQDKIDKLENEKKEKLKTLDESGKELAALLDSLTVAGDPVALYTGEYLCEYPEVIGKRKYSRGVNESFGINWTCPLDSRIVRCHFESWRAILEKYEEIVSLYQEALRWGEWYDQTYPEYSGMKPINENIRQAISDYKDALYYAWQIQKKNEIAEQYNTYVTYGRFAEYSSYYNLPDIIKFVDEYGDVHTCFFDGNRWTPTASKYFVIYGISESDGRLNAAGDSSGGFLVLWCDGSETYYSKYGILQRKTDRYGNVTEYHSNNGVINGVSLPTGEFLSIKRNSYNCIESISGNASGITRFDYTDGCVLAGYTNSDGIKVTYSYNTNWCLSEIGKADGTCVKIEYDIDAFFGAWKQSVSKITNENGEYETFEYSGENYGKKIIHTTYEGIREIYITDPAGRTCYKDDGKGSITRIKYDEFGNFSEIDVNGEVKRFIADATGKIYRTEFADGTSYSVEYRNNQIVKETDRDGAFITYELNDKNDCVKQVYCGQFETSMAYYPNGKLESIEDKNRKIEFVYDSNNQITEKTTTTGDEINVEKWTYNERKHPVKYENSYGELIEYFYNPNSSTEIHNNRKKIEHFFNVRGWEVKTVETDLWTGKKHTKELIYDAAKRLKRILLDGKLYCSFVYKKGSCLESVTRWNDSGSGYTTEYVLDSANRITQVVKYQVDKDGIPVGAKITTETNTYNFQSGNTIVNKKFGEDCLWKFQYDSEGRLIKLWNPQGDCAEYSFTPTGKAFRAKELDGTECQYFYENNGSYKVEYKDNADRRSTVFYDEQNRISKISSYNGDVYTFAYDGLGNKVYESGPEYTINYFYDSEKRHSGTAVYDENETLFYRNSIAYREEVMPDGAKKLAADYYEGTRCVKTEIFDAWGRKIEVTDSKGTVWNDYDFLGNIITQRDSTGRIREFSYNPYGDIQSIKDNTGYQIRYEYDSCGNLISVFQNNKKIYECEYDASGRILAEKGNGRSVYYGYKTNDTIGFTQKFNSGKTEYNILNPDTVEIKNSMGEKIRYELEKNGQLKSITNAENKTLFYEYDSRNRVIRKSYPSGKVEHYDYGKDSSAAARWISVSDGKGFNKKFKTDLGGKIIHAENNFSKFEYTFDESGLLVQMDDLLLNESVGYEYDQYKRCIRKFGSMFDFNYSYDELGRVCSVDEKKSGAWVNCKYNNEGLETTRNYSNGVLVEREYTDTGKTSSIIARNWAGQLLYGEYILYDSEEKIKGVFYNSGLFLWNEYDSDGRLVLTYSDFTPETLESKRKEAVDCGLFVSDSGITGIQLVLPADVMNEVTDFFREKGQFSYEFPVLENVWFDKYEYNPIGSMKTQENPMGCIIYEYDKLNRVIKKHGANTENEGVSIIWDDDGNLTKILAPNYESEYEYGFDNRPEKVTYRNLVNGDVVTQSFVYDAFGRRYGETIIDENGKKSRRFLYDGFTIKPLMETPVHQNGLSALSYEISDEESYGMEKLSDYKLASIDNENIENGYTGYDDQALNFVPQVYLELNGFPDFIVCKDSHSVTGAAYYLQIGDYKDSVHVITDSVSDDMVSISYDVWGNHNNDGQNQIFQKTRFAGSKFSIAGGISCYDLGLRDYIPSLKCFTSEDPAHDGANWYAYCSCDPVNFVDFAGFEMRSLNQKEQVLYENNMMSFMNFDQQNYLNTGSDMQIPKELDCADTSAWANYLALQSIGKTPESEMVKKFGDNMNGNNKDAAKNTTSSKDYQDGDTKNVRKLVDGFDNGYIKFSGANSSDPKMQNEKERKNEALKALSDPNTITPGTVLAWKVNKDYHSSKDSTNWEGHTATILGREYNPDGSIRGFICLEGHTGGGKTELSYINLTATTPFENLNNITSYFGDFVGAFALESGLKDYSEGCGS